MTTPPGAPLLEVFGHMPTGEPVYRVTLANDRLRVRIHGLGAAIQTIDAPDHQGNQTNVVLGLDSLDGYMTRSPHFGAVPGRYAGRIDHGRFTLDGIAYQLPINDPPHTLHGGSKGFGRRNWSLIEHASTGATFRLFSADGDEGFPGNVEAHAKYSLAGSALRLDLTAITDKPTIVNLTNHAYFNLAGEGSGDILGHELTIDADHFLPIAADLIPTGERRLVDRTPFDFRTPRLVGSRITDADLQLQRGQGYDHAYMVHGTGLRQAAVLSHRASGRTLTVETSQPAVQLYTGNTLDGTLTGPFGRPYGPRTGICLEAQHPQDSPNHPSFPSTTLRPSAPFAQTIIFTFGSIC